MTTYRIVVQGELSDRFGATFDTMRLDRVAGDTWITGEVVDQAQLQGFIARIADLGLALRSVNALGADRDSVDSGRAHEDGVPAVD